MLRSLLELEDGTTLSAGEPGAAIVTTSLYRQVNEEKELTPGSVVPCKLECQLTEAAGVQIKPGQTVKLYYREGEETPQLQGTFLVEKTTRRGFGILEITAYDRLKLLDRDMTEWLMSLTQWPYLLGDFAGLVCRQVGLELATEAFPNWELPVQAFSAAGVSGLDLLAWICQAAGRFCRATPEGKAELAWFTPGDRKLGSGENPVSYENGALHLTVPELTAREETGHVFLDSPYLESRWETDGQVILRLDTPRTFPILMGTLKRADYQTETVDKVIIRGDETDLGTVFPPESDALNAMIITGNPLLTAVAAEDLTPVAEQLYQLMGSFRYTPATMEIPATNKIAPGMILECEDVTGASFVFPVMTAKIAGQRMILTATGSSVRALSRAKHSYKTLSGRVLRLQADVEGLIVENEDARGALASLSLTAENLRTQVENQSRTTEGMTAQMSALEQTAQAVSLKVTTLEQEGATTVKTQAGYTFDDTGLRISKTGQQMVNLLDNTGMYVLRRDEVILQANDDGVEAADVTVRNYLNLGRHARLEDYSNGTDTKRTACYWMEGE